MLPFPLIASVVPNTCYALFFSLQLHSLLRSNSKSQRIRTVLSTQVRCVRLVLHQVASDARACSRCRAGGRSREEPPRISKLCQGRLAHCRPGSTQHGRSRRRTARQRSWGQGASDASLAAAPFTIVLRINAYRHDIAMRLQHGCTRVRPLRSSTSSIVPAPALARGNVVHARWTLTPSIPCRVRSTQRLSVYTRVIQASITTTMATLQALRVQ